MRPSCEQRHDKRGHACSMHDLRTGLRGGRCEKTTSSSSVMSAGRRARHEARVGTQPVLRSVAIAAVASGYASIGWPEVAVAQTLDRLRLRPASNTMTAAIANTTARMNNHLTAKPSPTNTAASTKRSKISHMTNLLPDLPSTQARLRDPNCRRRYHITTRLRPPASRRTTSHEPSSRREVPQGRVRATPAPSPTDTTSGKPL